MRVCVLVWLNSVVLCHHIVNMAGNETFSLTHEPPQTLKNVFCTNTQTCEIGRVCYSSTNCELDFDTYTQLNNNIAVLMQTMHDT